MRFFNCKKCITFILVFVFTFFLVPPVNSTLNKDISRIEKPAAVKDSVAVVAHRTPREILFERIDSSRVFLNTHKSWIKCVAMVESGTELSSDLAKHHYNVFGMMHPSRRPTMSKRPIGRYATFASYTDAVQDFEYWYDWDLPGAGEDFVLYMKRRGFNTETPSYFEALRRMKDRMGIK